MRQRYAYKLRYKVTRHSSIYINVFLAQKGDLPWGWDGRHGNILGLLLAYTVITVTISYLLLVAVRHPS